MILSLAAFRRAVPYDLRLWLFRLVENKAIPLETVTTFRIRQSWTRLTKVFNILTNLFSADEQPESTTQIVEELNSKWKLLREDLVLLGVLDATNDSNESSPTCMTVHPFFRFLLRQEIKTGLGSQGKSYLKKLQTAFCDLYEARAAHLATGLASNDEKEISDLTEFVEREEEDILEACRLTVTQSKFPIRVYGLHEMISPLFTICLSLPLGRLMELAEVCLLALNRFQQIITNAEWASLPDIPLHFRTKVVNRVLQLSRWRHAILHYL
jgi:hypothetical protein